MTHETTVDLTVITVLFSSAASLRTYVGTWAQAKDWPGSSIRFIFVDHGPESPPVVRQNIEELGWPDGVDVTIISQPNWGFAGGVIRALAEWDERSDLLLLNPDVGVPEDFWQRLAAWMSTQSDWTRGGTASYSFAVEDQRYGRVAGIGINRLLHFRDCPWPTAGNYVRVGPSGGAALLPREVVGQALRLWAPYFAWGEDADAAFRAFLVGVRHGVVDICLSHQGGHSLIGRPGRKLKARLLTRNRIWFWHRTARGSVKSLLLLPWLCFNIAVLAKGLADGTFVARGQGIVEALHTILTGRVEMPPSRERIGFRQWLALRPDKGSLGISGG